MLAEVDTFKLMNETMILRAKPARSPKVSVMDAYLKPLPGAKIFAKIMFGLTGVETLVGTTNDKGEVVVPAVYHGGKYVFRMALPGYCPTSTAPPPVGGKNWIDSIELVSEPATEVLKGKVVDAKSKPVSGVKVATDFGPSAVTDANGEFTLKQMPSWKVTLDARKGTLHGTNKDAKGNYISASAPIVVR